jgi:hypothetical protein
MGQSKHALTFPQVVREFSLPLIDTFSPPLGEPCRFQIAVKANMLEGIPGDLGFLRL